MTPERWAQIEELFHLAAECEPERRAAVLDEACHGDPELRQEVEALLACDRGAGDYVVAAVGSQIDVSEFPLTGQIVSHYRIQDGLGGGGMGLLYRAEDMKLGRQVALKFLPQESAKDPVALRRFEREARAASSLEHPNICPIYEFGEHNGLPFLVMQLLEGKTLQELISAAGRAKPSLAVHKLLDVAVQINRGLEAAHQRGIIHRDIKPANIFITTQGQAKILDFGLAKLAPVVTMTSTTQSLLDGDAETSAGTESLAPPDLFLSRTGALMGTAGYMSPEQVRGENLDARTDLFSFGLVLYEIATGKRAFTGDTWPAFREAILEQMPDAPRRINPKIPAKLEAVIKKALEKNRDVRYQTASEMRADLENLQRQLAPKHLSRPWVVASGTILTLLVAATVFLLERPSKVISVTPEIKLRQLTTNSSENPVIGGAISPDSKYLAYTDAKGMHIKLIETGETRVVPRPEGLKDQNISWEIGPWFPDSTRFLVHSNPAEIQGISQDPSIWMASVLGGAPRKLRDHAIAWAISPDGLSVSFGTNQGKFGPREVWMMQSDGGQASKFDEAKEGTGICCLMWSQDGQRYLYITSDGSGDTMLSRDLKGGPPTALFPPSEMKKMNDIVWLRDGRLLYSLPESEAIGSACNYWTIRLDLRTGKRVEEPRRLTNWPSFCVSSGSSTLDGKRVAFAGWSSFVTAYIADLEPAATQIRNLKHFSWEEAEDFIADWTPDSKTLIVGQNRGDHYAIYKQTLDSDTPDAIVPSVPGGLLNMAVVSPDGKWIIAMVWPIRGAPSSARPSAPRPLVRIPIAGGAPEAIFPVVRPGIFSCARPPSYLCVIPEQTEDHKQMVVTAFDPIKGRGAELARFDLARDFDVLVDNLLCDLSPDGTRLAITRSPEGPIEIHSLRGKPTYIIPFQMSGKLDTIKWAANRQGLFVSRKTQGPSDLLYVDLHGNSKSLYTCVRSCFGWPSPDGRHLAINETKQSTNMWMMENF